MTDEAINVYLDPPPLLLSGTTLTTDYYPARHVY